MEINKASDIARQRLNENIAELFLTIVDDIVLWKILTFLLEQLKNYQIDNTCDCSVLYLQDKEDAEQQVNSRKGGGRKF